MIEKTEAADWNMCAVGEAFSTFGGFRRYGIGAPCDHQLKWEGLMFGLEVKLNHYDRARTHLTAIEARLGEILLNPHV